MVGIERIVTALEKNKEILDLMLNRIEALERTVEDQQETITGLEVDLGKLVEEQYAYRVEIDELAADFDCFRQDENA